ncbi:MULTISPECIES: DUF2142 domain-containing protein [unclassified Leifsonia]|uniref:DUF2142 domain-containing protein n=1 Tax=unclassified Leifsonia TaxID=2663824 RepID=UPI0003758969|nr:MULTISPECIES: DUF2142 domain-containing protein [unclassified Leifsonia]TDQ02862.1 putative membrane protein DUF2142 [Leifsonia sp. 115AMFTsu3.1]
MTGRLADAWRATRIARIVLVPLLALVVLLGWALASPVLASPDDDFHQASIWCAGGEQKGVCEAVPGHPDQRAVPPGVSTNGAPCYGHLPAVSASCLAATTPEGMVTTDRVNSHGQYPVLFYATMHLFVSKDVTTSVLIMRAVNALLFVALSTAVALLLISSRRTTLVWGWLITLIPLGIFLVPSVNPSSWALTSAGLLWISLVGYFETRGWRQAGLGALAVVAAVIGGGARSDSALYSILSVGVAMLLTVRWKDPRFWLSSILGIVIAVISFVLYLTAGQSHSPLGRGGFTGSLLTLGFHNVLDVPLLWAGIYGVNGGTGWLDTTMPASVWVIGLVCFGALTFGGLRAMNWRKGLVLAGGVVVLVALPVAMLTAIRYTIDPILQPRYLLPLIIVVAGVALFQIGRHRIGFTRVQWAAVGVSLFAIQAVALHENIRRYVTGTEVWGANLSANVEWWWHLPFGPMAMWAGITVAFGLLTFFAVSEFRTWTLPSRGGEPATAATPRTEAPVE